MVVKVEKVTLDKIRELNAQASEIISSAKMSMVYGLNANNVFFRECLIGMEVNPGWWMPTLATDGKRMWYNPHFIIDIHKTTDKHVQNIGKHRVIGVLAHEIMHIILKHCVAILGGVFDPDIANIAQDLSINCLLEEAGYHLPEGGIFPGKPGRFVELKKFLGWVEYYSILTSPEGRRLLEKAERDFDKNESSQVIWELSDGTSLSEADGGPPSGMFPQRHVMSDKGGCGSSSAPCKGITQTEAEASSSSMLQKAISGASRGGTERGNLSQNLSRTLSECPPYTSDWRDHILDFASSKAQLNLDWNRPNRRMMSSGLCLPSITGDQLGTIAVLIDLSGSITDQVGSVFKDVCKQAAMLPEVTKLVFICHDDAVCSVTEWDSDESGDPEIEFRGGGGTSHIPAFKYIKDNPYGRVTVIK